MAEQRLSAQRSDARDLGKHLESRAPAEPVSRAASEKETSRLLAKTEVAREHLAHLIRTDAPSAQIKYAARIAHEFVATLDKTLAARKEMGRHRLPQVVYTTEDWKQLKEYAASRELPVRDDRAAGRLQAGRVLAVAELTDAHEKAEAFKASRHFWKVDVEGWESGLSLKEIEQAIKTKTADRFKLYNFLRPSKRREIGGQIDYLQDVKKDIQKQLAARELSIEKNVGAGEIKDVGNTVRRQQERAEEQSNKASDFSFVMDRILDEHCRAAGIPDNQVAPLLNAAEITEVREFAEKMPYVSRIRKEFTDAARQAESRLQQRETVEAARESQQSNTHDLSIRPNDQTPLRTSESTQRTDRDSLSRGR